MSTSVPVFVGSTFTDLQPYRAAVREALHGLEAVVRGMEYFGALPDTAKDECLRIVRGCRIYVGIFAMRYGSIDPATGKSLTHLEYEEAQRIGLPSLIYLVDEEKQPVLPKFVDTGAGAARLQELKNLLRKRHVVSFFTTPEDIAAKVTRDVPQVAARSGFEVRAGELARVVAALPRIDWMTDERFQYLKKKIGAIASPIQSDSVLREALEFVLSGDNLAASFLIARTTGMDLRASVDLLMQIDGVLRAVVAKGIKELAQQRGVEGPGESPPAI